jgi:nitrogen regulatory protein PII
MKLITAVVRPHTLDDVMRAVSVAGARGLTVTQVRGFGQQYGHMSPGQPASADALVLPKIRVEIVVNDELVGPVTEAIAKSVGTGIIGDGKIWVSPVESALRIRTGDRDREAV